MFQEVEKAFLPDFSEVDEAAVDMDADLHKRPELKPIAEGAIVGATTITGITAVVMEKGKYLTLYLINEAFAAAYHCHSCYTVAAQGRTTITVAEMATAVVETVGPVLDEVTLRIVIVTRIEVEMEVTETVTVTAIVVPEVGVGAKIGNVASFLPNCPQRLRSRILLILRNLMKS